MRSKIKVDDDWYKPVPWFVEAECDGCIFDTLGCINSEHGGKFERLCDAGQCDAGQEFEGMIFIRNTKEALAEYVAKRLGVDDDGDYVEGT